jgi:hypothetical protein
VIGSYIPTQTAAEVGANPVQVIDRYTIKVARPVPRAHARGFVHGRFLRLKNFCCKTAQFCVTRRKSEMAETSASATVRKPMKSRAKNLS